ncbi:MAG: thermonuclease family protein [Gallionella sp.]|nr:thermonuclease family protein [Gallionella sp.]
MSFILAACLVIAVVDGDTLTALCDQQQVKVRLAETDAPEKKQPFGQRSKKSLSEMCFNKQAVITAQGTDRYHRIIARVVCDGTDANAEQLKRGMACVYDKYVKDKSLYAVQDEARALKTGLWADANPMAPWVWRHNYSYSPVTTH